MSFAICILVFAILGVIINIAALIVISRKKNRSMFHDLLKILTVYDILVVICCALQFALPEIWPAYAEGVHPYVMVILLPVIHIAVMTFERYIRICFYCQLRDSTILSEDNIKYYQLTVILFPIFFYIPKFFEVRAEETFRETTKLVNCHNYIKLSTYLQDPKMQVILSQQFNLTDLTRIENWAKLCDAELKRGTGQVAKNSSSELLSDKGFRNITVMRSKVLSAVPTSLRKNVYYHKIYFVYLNTTFASILPLALLLFFNIRTAHELILMSRSESANARESVSYSNGGDAACLAQNHIQTGNVEENFEIIEMSSSKRHPNEPDDLMISYIDDEEDEDEKKEKSGFLFPISERRKSRVSFSENKTHKPSSRTCGDNCDMENEEVLCFTEDGRRESGNVRRSKSRFHRAENLVSNVRHSISHRPIINKSKERRLARISLCIVWLFIFCHVCKLIPTGYEVFVLSKDSRQRWPQWIVWVENVSHTLITLNSALNFVIYVVL